MIPKDFPLAVKYVVPAGQENNMYSMYAHHADGVTVSCWGMTDEEFEILSQKREVWLEIMGGLPPMRVSVESPLSESLQYNPDRLQQIGKIMDFVKQDGHTIMLGAHTQTVNVTAHEFERIIENLQMMQNETNRTVKQVAANVDTICIAVAGGGMLIVRR